MCGLQACCREEHVVSVIPGSILALSLLPCAHLAASGFHRLRTVVVEGVGKCKDRSYFAGTVGGVGVADVSADSLSCGTLLWLPWRFPQRTANSSLLARRYLFWLAVPCSPSEPRFWLLLFCFLIHFCPV